MRCEFVAQAASPRRQEMANGLNDLDITPPFVVARGR